MKPRRLHSAAKGSRLDLFSSAMILPFLKTKTREFYQIPRPRSSTGAGGDSDSPEAQAILKAREIGKQQSAVNEQAQKAINAYLR